MLRRLVEAVRRLFGRGPSGVGVREPRNPRRPTLSGSVAVEPPPDDRRDVGAVGRDR